ncbi:LCP family protein, partial [Streptomyces sp. NPDC054838]
MNDWPEPEGPQRMRHIQRQQPPVRQPGPPRPPADPPARRSGYGVPPQQAQSPGGYDSGYNTGQLYGTPAGGGAGRPPAGPVGPGGP